MKKFEDIEIGDTIIYKDWKLVINSQQNTYFYLKYGIVTQLECYNDGEGNIYYSFNVVGDNADEITVWEDHIFTELDEMLSL